MDRVFQDAIDPKVLDSLQEDELVPPVAGGVGAAIDEGGDSFDDVAPGHIPPDGHIALGVEIDGALGRARAFVLLG
jgi:hypothetical protein